MQSVHVDEQHGVLAMGTNHIGCNTHGLHTTWACDTNARSLTLPPYIITHHHIITNDWGG